MGADGPDIRKPHPWHHHMTVPGCALGSGPDRQMIGFAPFGNHTGGFNRERIGNIFIGKSPLTNKIGIRKALLNISKFYRRQGIGPEDGDIQRQKVARKIII